MRDYIVVLIILATVPIGLARPYYGMLVYTWVSYMYPHMLAWSFAQGFPAAKLTALSAIMGVVITRKVNTAPLLQRESLLMVLFWLTFTLSTFFSLVPSEAWQHWEDVSKLVIMAILTSMLVQDQKQLRLFLLVIAMSLGFYALKGGIFSIRTGGEHMIWGPGTSVIAGNNAMGLALNMCLPVFWYLAQEERGYLKYALYAMFFFSIPSIMFTYSRASALTLPLVLTAIMFRGRNRTVLVAALLIVALVAIPLIPQRFWDRQQTTVDYESDASAMSRLDNWSIAWRVALDRPITGAGFQFFTPEVIARYNPEFLLTYGKTWDTHNVLFGILACHGFPGLIAYLSMIAACFLSCRRMRRSVRRRADLRWVRSYCYLIEVSLFAFLVNGMFVNMEYFDLVYHWVGVVACLKVICSRALAEVESENPVVSGTMSAVPA